MYLYEAVTIEDIYPTLCRDVLQDGEENSPRGIKTFDLGLTAIEIFQPRSRFITNKTRRVNPFFLLAEHIWIITRNQRADMVGFYNKKMWDFSDDAKSLYGAYGPRLMYQLPAIINKIKIDRSTRQAVLTIFRPKDQLMITKDFPCNITLHFIPKANTLNLVVYVRSQDIFLGLPYDFYHWSAILEMVANEVEMDVGSYTTICGSLHAYERDVSRLEAIYDEADEGKGSFHDFDESTIGKFAIPKDIRKISTIEYKNRRAKIDEKFLDKAVTEIFELDESEIIKHQLLALLYYRTRKIDINNEVKKELLDLSGYAPVIKHLDWI